MSNADEAPRLSEQQPRSRVRYGVLFFLCTLAVLLYIDRVCIGQAEKDIRQSLGLTKESMSWVYNAFIIAYCIFEVPTGHWGDRFGSRGVIARIVLWWSAFTALTGAAAGLWSLVAMRFLFGAGEAGAFPNAARVVTRWFPAHERGRARAAITTTSLIGGAIAPPLAAYLIGLLGWRWTFAAFGTLGVVWTAAFYYWFRDDPAEHSQVNAAERAWIGVEQVHEDESNTAPAIPWGQVVVSPNVWLLGAIMVVSATLFYMQFQWYPTYLKEARGLSDATAGWFTGIVIVGGALGCVVGGWLADLIIRHTTERRWTRRLCGCGTLLLAAISLAGVRYSEQAMAATLCNSAALFFLQISIPTWWTVVAEISGRHGAAMWGLMNSLGGLGVFAMNLLVGRVVDAGERAKLPLLEIWQPVFDGVAIGLAFGAVCWLFVDATRSIVERKSM
jgi:ACS family glucarate transporter-like MFS transporter